MDSSLLQPPSPTAKTSKQMMLKLVETVKPLTEPTKNIDQTYIYIYIYIMYVYIYIYTHKPIQHAILPFFHQFFQIISDFARKSGSPTSCSTASARWLGRPRALQTPGLRTGAGLGDFMGYL